MKPPNLKTIFTLLICAIASFSFHAKALEKMQGEPVLIIHGDIGATNDADTAQFDIDMLQKFTPVTIKTETPWTDGMVSFTGVLARDVMQAVKANGGTAKATAVNDYTISIPTADFQDHDVIFAYQRNGKMMSIRDKGPLWVIYPWSDKPELKTELYHSRSIWQLVRIKVE